MFFDSTSSSSTTNITPSNQNTQTTQGSQSPQTNPTLSSVLGGIKSFLTTGSGSSINAGLLSKVNVNTTTTDYGSIQRALALAENALALSSDQANQTLNSVKSIAQTQSGILADALGQAGDIAANTASGGQTDANKTVNWLIIVVGIAAAIYFWRR